MIAITTPTTFILQPAYLSTRPCTVYPQLSSEHPNATATPPPNRPRSKPAALDPQHWHHAIPSNLCGNTTHYCNLAISAKGGGSANVFVATEIEVDAVMSALSDPLDRLDAAQLRVSRARARLSATPLARLAASEGEVARVRQDVEVADALVQSAEEVGSCPNFVFRVCCHQRTDTDCK